MKLYIRYDEPLPVTLEMHGPTAIVSPAPAYAQDTDRTLSGAGTHAVCWRSQMRVSIEASNPG